MFNLDANDLLQFRGSGGQRFAHFVDRLIRAEAWRCGLPQSEIETQLRPNIGDGGVDTHVKQGIAGSPNGWFAGPTCWQFKAELADSTTKSALRAEINKGHSKELIKQNCGYRYCLLGDVTPEKIQLWEGILRDEARKINPEAPDPRVVSGAHLLQWAEQLPAVVIWAKDVRRAVMHFDAWAQNPRAVTPRYVRNPAWTEVEQRIRAHVNFQLPPINGQPCLPIGGAAGVGKTRLVLETLAESSVPLGLIVYVADEREAKLVATALANVGTSAAILVADECSGEAQFFLNQLQGCVNRVRFICLDNAGARTASIRPQIWLPESLTTTAAILEENFPDIPEDRRRQYVELSSGFVRLAADMCRHDLQLAGGDMSGLLGSTENYVRLRLRREHLPLVSLLSLFHKVGSGGEVKGELAELCAVAGCDVRQFHDMVHEVRDSPGFVVQAGRYWYVTPHIVARVLFAEGWARWVASDPLGFVNALSDDFRLDFIDRAGNLGTKEVRDELAAIFRHWFNTLTAADLSDGAKTSLAVALVATSPERYLPLLRAIVGEACNDDLHGISGRGYRGEWGPRRSLVWLCEKLVSFPEFFDDCEECLFRLALCESEPQIGNNATSIWAQLFSVYLSGTATAFDTRLKALRVRVTSTVIEEAKLGFEGVSRALGAAAGKVVGPPVVAGRIRPADWEPDSADQDKACIRGALELCHDCLLAEDVEHKQLAFEAIVKSAWFLLHHGVLSDLSDLVTSQLLTDEQRRALANEVDRFLEVQESTGRATVNERAREYVDGVRVWIDEFRPSTFDGKLRSICARTPWDRRFASDPTKERDELDDVADAIVAEPSLLCPHLDWLSTPEAQAAERLGVTIGRADRDERCAAAIAEHAIKTGARPFLRGYIRGLVFVGRLPSGGLLKLITGLEVAHPEAAVDVLVYGGDAFDALERVIALVVANAVSATHLAAFAIGIGRRNLTAAEVGRLLPFFSRAVLNGDIDAGLAGVRFLCTILQFERYRQEAICLELPEAQSRAWELIDALTDIVGDHIAHEWSAIVEALAVYDPGRACSILGSAMLGGNSGLERQARSRLSALAPNYPDAVMAAFGAALLNAERGWHLQVTVCSELIAELPYDVVMAWVRGNGLDGARAIARHLPPPYADESGNPIVPAVTDGVLREFKGDDVFQFFLGGASSRDGWWGDGSSYFEEKASIAKPFLSHSNPRIRDWAKYEIARAESMAKEAAELHAERFLPS
jgi:hypothetical protein